MTAQEFEHERVILFHKGIAAGIDHDAGCRWFDCESVTRIFESGCDIPY